MKRVPFNLKTFLTEASHLQEAQKTPLVATLYIDETAPQDLQALVRLAFTSDAPNARVSISYFPTLPTQVFPGADLAIVVAGKSVEFAGLLRDIQEAKLPCMIVSCTPDEVKALAQMAELSILEDDLISPVREVHSSILEELALSLQAKPEDAPSQDESVLNIVKQEQTLPQPSIHAHASTLAATHQETSLEPRPLDDELRASLKDRMGRWVLSALYAKRFGCALAFPVVRKPLAEDIVLASSLQNAGIGLVSIIPGSDMPLMSANQIKMLLQIAAAYGEDLGIERIKEVIALVGAGFFWRSLARTLVGFVPFLGLGIKSGIGLSGTLVMGKAIIEYFEGNGKIETVIEKILLQSKNAYKIYQLTQSTQSIAKVGFGGAKIAATRIAASSMQGTARLAQNILKSRS